jgi:Iap family predicted aminopeptidase
MSQVPTDILGEAEANSVAWSSLERLVDIGSRMAGQDGEHEAAATVAAAFSEVGLREASVTEFDLPGWWRETSTLQVREPVERVFEENHELIALPGTPAGELSGEVVDVGYGLPEQFRAADLDGKVAMASTRTADDDSRWVHRMEKYAAAVEHGATGFLFTNHRSGGLPPTGEVGYLNRPGPIPGIGLSKELGDRLRRYGTDGQVSVDITVECRSEPSTSCNVEAAVGPDTEREILVTAHHDAHDIAEGARDNGVGCALVIETGRLLSEMAERLDTKVRLVTFGAEEVALNGSYQYVTAHDTDSVECVVNIDGAGASRTPKLRPYGFDEVRAMFERTADSFGSSLAVDEEFFPYTDAWPFVEEGIPAVTAGSTSDGTGRGWGHTHADTLDKIDRRDLRALAVIYLGAVLELASDETELSRRSPSSAKRLVDDSGERALRAAGLWS